MFEFIYKYFILPYENNLGYNLINSFTYGIFLILFLLGLNKLSKHFRIKVTEKLVLSTLPFIFFGSMFRVFEDALLLPKSFIFVTPTIYILYLCVLLFNIFICRFTKHFERNLLLLNSLYFLSSLLFFRINLIEGLFLIVLFYFLIISIMLLLRMRINFLQDNLNFIGIAAHFLDATATFVTLDFFSYLGYWEQHPIPRLIGTLGNSFVWFYVLKLFVVVVLYYIDKDVSDKNLRNILKWAVIFLGLGPGLRDSFRLIMGV